MSTVIRHNLLQALLFLSFLLLVSSCNNEDLVIVPDNAEVRLVLRVPTRAYSPDYEDGTTDENYINVDGRDIRIYFFDKENETFLTRLEISSALAKEGTEYKEYEIKGKVSRAKLASDFKMVVLANWGNYATLDAGLSAGVITSLTELCNHRAAQYNYTPMANAPFKPGATTGHLIPFFGVHTYTDVIFSPDEETSLVDPVWLLRAMAKVEVIMEDATISCQSVMLRYYNSTGYCAPLWSKGMTANTDLVWWQANSATLPLHLVNGTNDTDEKETAFYQVEGAAKQTWGIYIPEYLNTGEDITRAELSVQLSGETTPRPIYFVDYEGGKPVTNSPMDIRRNTIYRFIIGANPLLFKVSVQRWIYGGKAHLEM